MYTGKTGWALTAEGTLFFTNDMFQTVTRECIAKNDTEVTISSITKAYKDRHLFAVSENSEIFRY